MWFVDGVADEAPMPVNVIPDISDDLSMWLVEGPSDSRPMPLEHQNKQQPQKKKQRIIKTPSPSCEVEMAEEIEIMGILGSDLPKLLPINTETSVRLSLIGATGLVGRACSTYIAQQVNKKYTISHFVGSKLSEGKTMAVVSNEKESILQKNYGNEFWDSKLDVDTDLLLDSVVCDVDKLLKDGPSSCDIVLSFLAPRFGEIENTIIQKGFRLVSISPHDRMKHPLIVPVVNGHSFNFISARCIKSK